MAFTLTRNAKLAALGRVVNPTLVLEIDGIDTIFGIGLIKKFIRIGDPDLYIGPWPPGEDWVIGGFNEVDDQLDVITFDGTTTQISQQLLQDKGGTSSVSSIAISLIDKNEEITRIITPGEVVPDILGRKAKVWLGFKEAAFKQDYILIFRGIIDDIQGDSKIVLNIAHPEQKKRQELFSKVQVELDGSINNSVTTITLSDVSNLKDPADGTTLKTYVRIDDEIIEYTARNEITNELTGCVRGQLGTVAAAHSDEAGVDSFYRLQGNPIDLALKLQLSGLDGPWVEDLEVFSFVQVDPLTSVTNAIVFDFDISAEYGVRAGDKITTTGATNGANNITESLIDDVVVLDSGQSYVVLDSGSLVVETNTPAVAAFRSQYDVLGHGVGMGGDEVDVAEFERIRDFAIGSLPDMDFYLKDSINAKDFIDKELLFPSACYSLPRKGRASLGYTSPPLAISSVPVLDKEVVMKPNRTQIRRSLGKFFYNTIQYRFEEDPLEEKFLAGRLTVSADSVNRIEVGIRPMTITSKGIRNTGTILQLLDQNSERLLERYKFAAEVIKIKTQYGIGFNVEVGDIVLYGDNELLLPDVKKGSRSFGKRLMEVINKSMNIKTGEVDLDLVDTNFLTNGRYGIFSPASIIQSGSTTTRLKLADSFHLPSTDIERDKWISYLNEDVLVHPDNWSVSYTTRLIGFDASDPYVMIVDPLPAAPSAGWTVEIAHYPDNTDPEDQELSKNVFCFTDPSVAVVSGVSQTEFVVGALDTPKFFVGSTVRLHNTNFTDYSPEVDVTAISGNNITVSAALGFTPSSAHTVELIGFKDEGAAYRYI